MADIAFVKFKDQIVEQFKYGGQKYAHSGTKESTDVLFDKHTFNWLIGTLDKYTFRYINTRREKDPLKIATYCFIIWLKRGFHINKEGTKKAIDTTVNVKSKHFPGFMLKLENHYKTNKSYYNEISADQSITRMSDTFGYISKSGWTEIIEDSIFSIFCFCFAIWRADFYDKGLAGKDTDTDNEEVQIDKLTKTYDPVINKYFKRKANFKTLDKASLVLAKLLANEVVKKGKENGVKN